MTLSKKESVTRMIKLSQNENPFGASPMALQAIADNYQSVYRYPEITHDALRNRLAQKYDISPDRIIVSAGSVEAVDVAIKTFVGLDDNIVTAAKTFVAYRLLAGINRRECRRAELTDNTVDLDNLMALCDDKTRVIFVANPNNPTGTIVSHRALSMMLETLPSRILVVVDEAYAEYVTDDSYPDSFELQRRFENLIIFRTFSKMFGLAGLRVGYAIASEKIIETLAKNRTQFSVNRLATTAALAALDDTGFVKECAAVNHEERTTLYTELTRAGLNVTPSQGNFLFVECGGQREKDRIYKLLKSDGIIVRELGPFGVEQGLRMSVGRPEENRQLIDSLQTL